MVNLTNKDIWYTLALTAIFATGYLSFSIIYHLLISPILRRRQLKRRKSESSKEEAIRAKLFKKDKDRDINIIISLIWKIGWRKKLERLQRQLLQADIYWDAHVFLGVVFVLAIAGLVLGQLYYNVWTGIGLFFFLGALPFAVLKIKIQVKALKVEKQLPEVMELLARSLRAGHTLPSAILLGSQETPRPLGTELRITYEEQRLGISMGEALRHMAERVASPDLRYFVTAVQIQTETGGNLAEVMEKIGYLIRERLKIKAKIRGLTAEGRLSAIILGAIPFVMFLLFYFMQRSYIMTLLQEPIGRKMLVAGMISISIGIFFMKKLINQVKV